MTKLTKRALLVVLAVVCVLTLALTACQATATLTFVGGEGATGTAPEAITANVGEEITLPANTFTKEGYTFAGWKIGDKTLPVGDKYTLTADAQAVAQWTENGTPEPDKLTVFFSNAGGWSAVYAYSWYNDSTTVEPLGSWPGSAMTAVTGHEGWMQLEIEAELLSKTGASIKFTNNAGAETKNFALNNKNSLYYTQNNSYASFAEAEAEVPPANTVLYFYNADGWSEVRVHSWIEGAGGLTGDWPGQQATLVDGHEGWVSYEFDRHVDEEGFKVIFNNGNGAQTENLDVIGENIYFINAATNYAYASFAAAEAAIHTVTFDPNNGEDEAWTVKVVDGETVAKPATDPTTESGKAFRYWKTENDGEYSFATPVTGDLELTAVYAWKVTFAAGEGATGTAPEDQWTNTWTMQGIILPDATGLSNDGKVFAGWSDGEETYQAGIRFVGTGNHTLTAVWEEQSVQPTSYMVTYLKSTNTSQAAQITGELPANGEVAVGATITMPTTLSLPHYTHTWKVQCEKTDEYGKAWETLAENLAPGAEYTMPAKEIRIFAVWTAKLVTISFDGNGAEGTMNSITQNYGSKLTLTAAKFDCQFTAPANMIFEGWSNTANGAVLANQTVLDDQIVSDEYTITLYAIWKSTATAGDPFVTSIQGKWTTDGHTVLVAIADGTATDAYDNPIVGYIVLDGQFLLNITEMSGAYYAQTPDFMTAYAISLSEGTLTMENFYEEDVVITFSAKTELVNADRDTFVGNWSKVLTTGSQAWTITETEASYGLNSTKVKNSMVIGDYLVMTYGSSNDYVYILAKGETNLEGWFMAPEKDPESTTFTPAA